MATESLGDRNRRQQAEFANGISGSTTPAVANIGGTPPIAQPAPIIAPITPVAPIAKQDYGFMGANNAPVQANIAPVVPQSSVSIPQATTVAPTPIEAPKTETLGEKNARQQAEFAKTTKVTTPTVDFNTSTGREQDILKNLNEGFNNAPALFQNQDSYRQAYGYDNADQGKKAILDSFFAGKQTPTDTNSIFATLLSGGQITNPQITNTAEYKNAVGRIDKVNTIKGYDQGQISTLLAEGKLVPGTQLYKDLSTDPATMAKITNAQKLNVINKVPVNKENVLANAAESVIDETPLGKAFKDGYISAEEADSFTRTPEIKAKEIEIEKKKTAYDALKAEYDDMENSVREELKGKASEGYIQALIGERQKNIFKRLNVLSSDYSNAMGTYSEMKKSLADTFQLNVGLYKDKQANIAQNARDERNFAQQKEMVSLQQAYQNPDINSTNPQIAQIATQKLIDESLKFAQTNGVPVTRNSGAILADAKAFAQKNGVSLAQAIQTTFTDPLTAKKEYQSALYNIRNKDSINQQNDLQKMQFQFDLGRQGKAIDLKDSIAIEDYKASLDPDKAAKWQEIADRATENTSLADLYGTNVGTYKGNRGYDLAGKMGDALVAPEGAEVVEVRTQDGAQYWLENGQAQQAKGKDVGYGNSVLLKMPDGKYMRLSHLQDINVQPGATLTGGQMVGTRGNSGKVLGRNGEKLTPEQLAAGRGAHVDVEIGSALNSDGQIETGSLLSNEEQKAYLNTIKPFSGSGELSNADIQRFNNPTFKPDTLKDSASKAKYKKFIEESNSVFSKKDVSINDILKYSAGGKDTTEGELKTLSKFDQALGQIGELQKNISTIETGPILGRLRSMNPYDTPAQTLKAQLNSLIPNLARGVYGEVGVLTDQDIQNYAKTIPNLTSTEDVNNAILAMTLDTIAGGYKKQLRTLAAGGKDVSRFVSLYEEIKGQSDYLKSNLGNTSSTEFYNNY